MTDISWATRPKSDKLIGYSGADDNDTLRVFCLYCVRQQTEVHRNLMPLYNAKHCAGRTALAAGRCDLCSVPLTAATLFHLARSGEVIQVRTKDTVNRYAIQSYQQYGMYWFDFYDGPGDLGKRYQRPSENHQDILLTMAQLLEWCAENDWVRE